MSMAKYLNRSLGQSSKDAVKRICTLKPIEAEHCAIQLVAGKQIIGRSKETGIRDTRCSKQQLQLLVDLQNGNILMKVLGLNPCSVNGVMAMQGTECELQHGDLLEIIYGRHPYEVVFNPAPVKVDVTSGTDNEASVSAKSEVWDAIENGKLVIYTSAGVSASEKIAGYDMDGTIIKTKSGNVFPKNTDDWQIIFPEVPAKLQRLQSDGFKICFFTNQAGIAKGKVNLDDFKQKVKQIVQKVGVPVQVFIAVGDGYYRKPLPGMWEHLLSNKNEGMQVNLERSFFVGDAAGRPETGRGVSKQRKDHSLADRLFASNIGISFYTPEEHFLGKPVEQWNKLEFDPNNVHEQVQQYETNDVEFDTHTCEMIIMVGLPGSGKSHFCQDVLASCGYKMLNADTLGSTQACLTAAQRALSAGKSCVIDNTNVDATSRSKFLKLAAEMKIKCRCFVMNVTPAQVKHNIAFRQLSETTHSKINDMVFNMMKKKYKEPTLDEGFTEIHKVNFKPKFSDDKSKRLYKMYLVEK